jgi:uncharacterized protein (DUF4415 family)
MAKKGTIVSYTAEEVATLRKRGADKTDWAAVDAKSGVELSADTASDPAWDGIPEDWYEDAVARTGPLLRPKENKRQVTMRFDADVLDFFKREGRGWEGRMNAVLRSFVERQER